jgi:methionine-rich copper-binding protein CopC
MSRRIYKVVAASLAGVLAFAFGCTDSTGPKDQIPPAISANTPTNGSNSSIHSTVAVTFDEPIDSATINSTTFNVVTATGAAIPGTLSYSSATQRAEFKPPTSFPSSTTITATVTTGVKDLAGNGLSAPFIFSFTTLDEEPPTIIATSPANGATAVSSFGPFTLTFSESMDASTINGTNISMRLNSNGALMNAPVTYNAATRTASLTPVSSLAAPRSFTVTVGTGVKDSVGNRMSSDFQFVFNTGDGTPPTVVSIEPADGKIGATIGSVIKVTFSEPMEPRSFYRGSVALSTASGESVTGEMSYDAATRTATFTPNQLLREATAYVATVTIIPTDVSGLNLTGSTQSRFVTVDNTPPMVMNITGGPLASGSQLLLELNARFRVTFTEALDPSTVNSSTVLLRDVSTGSNVPGSVTYGGDATFTPSAPLEAGKKYTATVTKGVKDLSGNALAVEFTKDFFTTGTPDITRPQVVSTSPADGETGVRTNGVATILFSEDVVIPSSSVLFRNSSTGVPIDVIVSQASGFGPQKFVLTPRFELQGNTRYTITLTTSIHDSAGNALAADHSFSFTTAP